MRVRYEIERLMFLTFSQGNKANYSKVVVEKSSQLLCVAKEVTVGELFRNLLILIGLGDCDQVILSFFLLVG